jgi:DNA polymerase-3 subunit epsilon
MSQDGSTIVLRRFEGGVSVDEARESEAVGTLLVVDVETTGVDVLNDRVIELAFAQMGYGEDGQIVRHDGTEAWLEDPGRPIPDEVVSLTGITDQMVKGRRIPDDHVTAVFEQADMIVSHNASFDWPFCRRRWPDAVDGKLWGCSLQQIDWSAFPSARQEILTRYHGFFYDGHRATIDVEALVRLLQMRPAPDQPCYLGQLIQYLAKPRYRIRAVGTPFEAKDDLKRRKYRWDGDRRVWWTTCSEADLPAERAWLDELYGTFRCRGQPDIRPVDPRQQWA